MGYINGFSQNVRDIFERFEFDAEIAKMSEANILYLVVSKFCDIDLHPETDYYPQGLDNIEMGLLFEELIRRFNEAANETAGDHFTPREVKTGARSCSGAAWGAERRGNGTSAHIRI